MTKWQQHFSSVVENSLFCQNSLITTHLFWYIGGNFAWICMICLSPTVKEMNRKWLNDKYSSRQKDTQKSWDPGGLEVKAKNENVNMILQSFQMMKNLVIYFSCECMNIKMLKSLQNAKCRFCLFYICQNSVIAICNNFYIVANWWQIHMKDQRIKSYEGLMRLTVCI